jgi:hypothetical protein
MAEVRLAAAMSTAGFRGTLIAFALQSGYDISPKKIGPSAQFIYPESPGPDVLVDTLPAAIQHFGRLLDGVRMNVFLN